MERKKERDLLAAQEESEIKVQSAKKGGTQKMSRAQIRKDAEKKEAIARSKDPAAKGQIKSEWIYEIILQLTQNSNWKIWRISALGSKKRSIKKVKALSYLKK